MIVGLVFLAARGKTREKRVLERAERRRSRFALGL